MFENLNLLRNDISLLAMFLIAKERYELGMTSKEDFVALMDYYAEYLEGLFSGPTTKGECYNDQTQCIKE